jgi:hypothetical protein
MNIKRYVLATLAMFIFVFLYEWLVHGVILMSVYEETPKVWRDFSEMSSKMPLAMGLQFLFSAWCAFVFTQFYPNGGLNEGIRFGIYFGVFAGILTASWYLWLPIAAKLGWSWFISGVVEGIGSGCILGLIYREK